MNLAISGNPTKALKHLKKDDLTKPMDFLQKILENKNRMLNISLKSISDIDDDQISERMNRTLNNEIEKKEKPVLNTIRVSSTKKFQI
jgi:hypothetical protein